jgi:hypothetical protein
VRTRLERIFEPFFSTKFSGRGLGLPSVLGIVQAHRGVIKLRTEPERGTTLRVLFPPSARTAAAAGVEARATEASSAGAQRGAGTILVVDDDETLLALRERRPGLPVILVTGYDAERAAERFAARGLDDFLRKPYDPDQLIGKVRLAVRR